MREYIDKKTELKTIDRIVCNGCGRIIPVKNGLPAEDMLSVKKLWGYFSDKDGQEDSFDLCESCYDRITREFRVPVTSTEMTEAI